MGIFQESGHKGFLVSLAGVVDSSNRGRQVESSTPAVSDVWITVLVENQKRIAAMIQNIGGVDVYLDFGTNTGHIILQAKAIMQIDENFPWCGIVNAGCTAGLTSQLYITEVRLP